MSEESPSRLASNLRNPSSTFSSIIESTIASTRQVFGNVMSLRGGRSRNNSPVPNNSRGRKEQQPLPGEEELESLLADAAYEVHQDPYRGLQSQLQSLATGTQITTPWNACIWGTLQPEDVKVTDLDSVAVVRHVGYCACPSMKAWTRSLQEGTKKKKKGKKRARLSSPTYSDQLFAVGTRPSDKLYRCRCDFNPLCLGSLGGVVNDILIERSKETDMEGPEPMDVDEQEDPRVAQHEKVKEDASAKGNGSSNTRVQAQSVLERLTSPENNDSPEIVVLENEKESSEESEKSATNVFAFLDETAKKEEPLAKLKPLERETEVVEVNPADVFTEELPASDLLDISYPQATETLLKSLRHTINSDAKKIRNYTLQTLCLKDQPANGSETTWTVQMYMQALVVWQKSLSFVNPLHGVRAIRNEIIEISLPPGIENLGATCYLNTQLQCLAQNPAFLNGIFSWRVVNSTHNMNSVMSKMQLLFAQMVLGGDCKLSTLDFSNALGLQHNEQQDPNEFARLLFERMEESFQQCDKDGDLANLLRHIFQGATTYETICMTCQHTSERSEGFMDLNIPIVKRAAAKDKSEKDIKDFFGKSADTDVQYCLDQYICAEILDGDNQYFCSECDCKRDARRVLKLTELPPVLNVQLSRYVFDLTQYVKKKLSDKVLLPTTLSVPKSDGTTKKYLLCAVMRHQGTSAYSGHYVAEAMDWLTGQWFEFNDEIVKLLPNGPSSSYDPCQNETADKEAAVLSGSQDAYNMYYVDESYLAQNALDQLSRRASHCAREDSGRSSETMTTVLAEVAKKRQQKYATLSEMCIADGQTADRLRRRRNGIRKFMFQSSAALTFVPKQATGKNDESVWVEADFLRRFLCLESDLDNQIRSAGPILRHKLLLCEHDGLHPEVSRKGKILPRSVYDAYCSLLKGEQRFLRQESKLSSADSSEVNDEIVTPSTNLFCHSCAQVYRNHLSNKLSHVRNIKDLFDQLDPTLDENQLQVVSEEEIMECPEEGFTYGVSKRMVTKYRNAVKQFLQVLAKLDDGVTINGTAGSGGKLACEGLDSIDISIFEGVSSSLSLDWISAGSSKNQPLQLARNFNAEIVCSHGNSNVLHNGRLVRFVSWKVWRMLKKVFPEAVEVKKKRIPDAVAKLDEEGCPQCKFEKLTKDQLVSDLSTWSKETQENAVLKDLIDGKRTVSRESEVKNFTTAKGGCRLVHQLDIESWRSAVKSLSKPGKISARNSNELKAHVESIAFLSYHSVVLEFERQPVEKLVTSLRPLICRAHKLVIETAVFKLQGEAGDPVEGHFLSDCIAVLSDEEYRAYISSLAALLPILYPDPKDLEVGSMGSPVLIDTEKSLLHDIRRITDSYHPRIKHVDDQHSSDDILAFALGGSSKEFLLSPGVCHCETCKKEFAPLLVKSAEDVDDRIESISVDSLDSKTSNTKQAPTIGSILTDPILVESDIEETPITPGSRFRLRVFEVQDNASVDLALKSLEDASALPPAEKEGAMSAFLRRSSRKRRSRYPVGCLLSESVVDVGLHHNVAALLLLMYEKCELALSGCKLTLVQSSNGKPHNTLEITLEWSSRSLEELVDEMQAQPKENGSSVVPAPSDLLVLYQKEDNGQLGALNEHVFDSLLQVANLEEPAKKGKNKKKRNRSSERGFQGTLLHSAVPSVNNENADSDQKRISSKFGVSEISDEENDGVATVEIEVTEKKPQVVLSDSSYDAPLPAPSPFSREVTHETKSTAKYNSPVATEHSIIKPLLNGGVDVVEENSIEIETNATDQVQEDLVASLLELLGEPADQSKCWDAVEWSLKTNPLEKNREVLLESAVEKYFSS